MAYLKPTQALRDLVRRVVKECHPTLKDTPIECVFKDKASGGEIGKLHIKRGVDAYLYFAAREEELGSGEVFLVLEVGKDLWQMLDDDQKAAAVDHYLCGAQVTADGKLVKCEPDLVEFNEVAARRGKWNTSVKDFARALQGKLPLEAPSEDDKKGAKNDDEKPRVRKGGKEAAAPPAEAGA